MNENERKLAGVSVCNDLLRRELAAVEVYGLAAKLLDDDLGENCYGFLQNAHRENANIPVEQVEKRSGVPGLATVGWDRPRNAILCAATIYGSESPPSHLSNLEREIVEAYRAASSFVESDEALQSLLANDILVRTLETRNALQTKCSLEKVLFAEAFTLKEEPVSHNTVVYQN
ncbi:hypothetical protein [Pelagicoccus sp. SDUM812002]|uniref:hypothetical protein n=1 Tax=Pelagicoccus sp. SDUM812002 TaxID=3041266 RepID=UPI00280E3961|nr:hypothetical protein [Pelagicoccus sp. SDUM812002]MDQ8187591.1 hypothetical protein [Pelagicoccus sp. SDUM812002]